jgi:putative ABC transport system substrate-binding protein
LKRRDFITLAGGAAFGWPGLTLGQTTPKALRLGMVSQNPRTVPFTVAFERRMRELGYIEGQNFFVEFIDTLGQTGRIAEGMQEVVRRGVDIVLAAGPEDSLKSALAATSKLPIVMIAIDYDPVARGYVMSLARPTGNVTGVFFQQIELTTKRLQVLKDAFPAVQATSVFWDRASADQWQATKSAGPTLGLRLAGVQLRDQPYDYEQALAQAPPDHRGSLVVMTSPIFFRDRARLAEFALAHRIPSMFVFREWVEVGGLLSYGPSITGMFRRAAEYVDRIAWGAKPADLPIEQPTKFELVFNLKTAKALGLTVPPSLLARADEVIE